VLDHLRILALLHGPFSNWLVGARACSFWVVKLSVHPLFVNGTATARADGQHGGRHHQPAQRCGVSESGLVEAGAEQHQINSHHKPWRLADQPLSTT